MKQPDGLKILIAIVVAAVVIVVGIGFYLSGTPSNARAEKLDQQRVNDLMEISNAINAYSTPNNKLPHLLGTLRFMHPDSPYPQSIHDPLTGQPYEYDPYSPLNYRLCATFQTDTTKDRAIQKRPKYPSDNENFWLHPAGKKCFSFNVRAKPGQPMM